MERSFGLLLVLITLVIIHIVQAQDQNGFISLDCGLPEYQTSPYNEASTGLLFSSDKDFIQSGKTGRVQENPKNYLEPYLTLRYFPEGKRNCYNLSVDKGRKYLIGASFVYGNYDGRDIKPVFDLYLGPNLWATIDLQRWVNGTREEILHIPTSKSLQICLVRTGTTTPAIAALELRPLRKNSYITQNGSLSLVFRRYFKESGFTLRYMEDVSDRLWVRFFMKEWTQISTNLTMKINNNYVPPEDALKNAATPTDTSAPLTINWSSESFSEECYLYAHFAEIQDLQANETREFNILLNGEHYYGPVIPKKLDITTVENVTPKTCQGGVCSLQLTRTNRSTLPPLLNALEVYRVIQFPQSETDESDVDAIIEIAATYALNKTNWQGDPCVPEQLRWDGLNCKNTEMSTPPRITSLNLSSSGLNGNIVAAIQSLTKLKKLDLSNNNLTGEVPEFLGNMESLSFINLSWNTLNGSIPQSLQKKGVELSVEGNPRLCLSDSCRKPSKKKFPMAIVASIPVAIVASVFIVVLFLVLRRKKSTVVKGLHLPRTPTEEVTFANKNSKRRFTYSEVIQMTNNFEKVLGKGGFDMVYHGTVSGSEQVAVKVLSQSSTQGYKEFKAEVDLLLRVHHTNLVSLVGYCYEGDHLALIYEFLPNGDLKQHLSGKRGRFIINWSTRLQIALEAALGLGYLHIGCKPPMAHRDVKTANILLDDNFKDKLSDFGLSRPFQGGGESQQSTVIAGTPGYLDPEYHHSGRLGEKSDVYSFGVELLEMITNQPVINQTNDNSHITQWVAFMVNRGNIIEIMDPNLSKDYDINSAWRALELAMSCANPSSSKRPPMSQVIQELKECIVCENSGIRNNQGLESEDMNIDLDTSVVPRAR
ncbi:PREDICTED: receptor-like protein kinase At5g59670 [Camelina sativa]|uniref:non-specific serine/threonine protein kinase n=1 Tax=Camelina sativa TaxID=90675 RepID=A0ABM1QME8_CAMSA|nr:PREDICTED: receptor-like protein kinase At5g59670 [Camelina sativa]XP_019087934.1 PREDICTED: receptor-like protein kinase At5g59670 [Camelina sativa]XP_019087935.1 PREDICTED: receptor-like protein kinase At5g59670 [Camelina sativa]XP_019087936.1 PREDICTED: receptor-like protein kinase At5g59670 [Camelina sativa]